LEYVTVANGRSWTWEEEKAYVAEMGLSWGTPRGWKGHYVIDRKCRDKKVWDKPDKCFKSMKRRVERSRVNAALRNGKEVPEFRKSDRWDWT